MGVTSHTEEVIVAILPKVNHLYIIVVHTLFMNAKTTPKKQAPSTVPTLTVNKGAKSVTLKTPQGTHTLRLIPPTKTGGQAKIKVTGPSSKGSSKSASGGNNPGRTLSVGSLSRLGGPSPSVGSGRRTFGGGDQRATQTVLSLPKAKVTTVHHSAIKAMIQTYSYDPTKATHPFDSAMNAEERGVAFNMGGAFHGHRMEVEHTKDGLLFKSRDFLQDVAIAIANNPGDILYSLGINPSLFTNTRTALIAAAFQLCRISKLHIMWKTRASAADSGAVLLFADNDPYFPVSGGTAGERQGESDPSAADIPVWYNGGMVFHNLQTAWLATDPVSPDKRWTDAGTIYCMLTGSVPEDRIYGTLILETEIEFKAELLTVRSMLGFANLYESIGGNTAANPFGTDPRLVEGSNLSSVTKIVDSSGNLIFRLLPGNYVVILNISGATGLATAYTWAAGDAITMASGGGIYYASAGATGTSLIGYRYITVAGGDFESPADRELRVYVSTLTTATVSSIQFVQTPAIISPASRASQEEMVKTIYERLGLGSSGKAELPALPERSTGSSTRTWFGN